MPLSNQVSGFKPSMATCAELKALRPIIGLVIFLMNGDPVQSGYANI
jgi:hypothetical protein